MIPVLNFIHLPKELFPTSSELHTESIRREHNIKAQAYEHKFTYGVWDGILDVLPFRGISRSHKQIVQHAKDNGLNLCFIAEDDVKIYPGGWSLFLETLPTEFDLYFAGISGGAVLESNNPSEAADVVGATGMFLYAIHHRFYDVFLAADEEKNIDCWLSKETGLLEVEKKLGRKPVYKVCYPMAAITNDGVSYNSGKDVRHEKFFKSYRVLGS